MFIVILLAVVGAAHTYLYFRLRDALGPRRRRWVLLALLVLALAVLATPLGWMTGFGRNNTVLSFVSFSALGGLSLLATLRIMGDLFLGLTALAGRIGKREVDEGRRVFLRRAVDASVIGGAAVMGGAGTVIARKGPELVEVEVPVEGLAPGLDGFRIAQISDLHVGPTVGRGFVQPIVDRVNALKPDLIAVTGDLVDGTPEQLADGVAPLAELKATQGVWFCTGNHEYYSGAEAWVEKVKELGMTPLMNEHVVVEHKGAQLCVAGVTDHRAHTRIASHKCDPAAAMKGAPAAAFKLLLAHQPRSAYEAEKAGFELQLSGHTHGGQFFPWNFVIHLIQPFVAGLHKTAGMWVYVNRGTAYWGPPLRLGPTSEITLLRLKRV